MEVMRKGRANRYFALAGPSGLVPGRQPQRRGAGADGEETAGQAASAHDAFAGVNHLRPLFKAR